MCCHILPLRDFPKTRKNSLKIARKSPEQQKIASKSPEQPKIVSKSPERLETSKNIRRSSKKHIEFCFSYYKELVKTKQFKDAGKIKN